MATEATQLRSQLPEGPIYADPLKPDFTVRFKTTSAAKSLNGVRTENYITEIILNDSNSVTIGNVNAIDAVSVRLRVSGSAQSMTRVKAIVDNLGTQLAEWTDEKVLLGFNPTTAPTNPI